MGFPYENASGGKNSALAEIQKTLKTFGADKFAVAEDWSSGEVAIHFQLRGRTIKVKANSYGYTKAWLARNPTVKYNADHEKRGIKLGQIAVWSMLRDWIKGQCTAIEVGMLTVDQAFIGQIVLESGETVMERIEQQKILPQIEGPKS